MKPSRVQKLFFVIFLGMITLQAECQTVGLLMDSYVTDRWYKDQKLFTDRIKELGGDLRIEVAYGDPTEQVLACKNLISEGVKVLVVIPVDAQRAVEIAEIAKAANIPLISYDRLILSNDVSLYVSYNNEQVGELQAQYALSKVPIGSYLMVHGPVTDNNSFLLRKGQLNVLKAAIDRKEVRVLEDLIMDDWGELGALMRVDNFFSYSKEKPAVVIAANDALAGGVIQALPKELKGKIVVTGQDADVSAVQHIIDGSQAMTIYKPIKPLAYLAAEAAMKLAKGEAILGTSKLQNGNITVNSILLKPIIVDKSNYKETVLKDGHFAASELVEKN
jgi:D-xylose transport system substrate-binding protein